MRSPRSVQAGSTRAAGAEEVTGVQVDSRLIEPGDLFVAGRAGARTFTRHDVRLVAGGGDARSPTTPFAGHCRAREAPCDRAARPELVVGITGSTGKTSTKDILARAVPAARATRGRRRRASTTRSALPLTSARLERGTRRSSSCEMGMRGLGQIAELCADRPARRRRRSRAVGPVHLELLGTGREVSRGRRPRSWPRLPEGGAAIVRRRAASSRSPRRDDIEIVTFRRRGTSSRSHMDGAALASFAGSTRSGSGSATEFTRRAPGAATPRASPPRRAGARLRGARGARRRRRSRAGAARSSPLPGDGLLINDCLQRQPGLDAGGARAPGRARPLSRRQVAVLGDMAELGAGRGRVPPRGRRRGSRASASTRSLAVGELARGYVDGRGAASPDAGARRRGGRAGQRSSSGPATPFSSRARARSGSSIAEALAGRDDSWPGGSSPRGCPRHGRSRSSSARSSSSSCAGRSSASTIREEGPRGTIGQAGHADDGRPADRALDAPCPSCLSGAATRWPALTVFFVTLACAAIGFADDFMKVRHRRSLGLSGRWKLAPARRDHGRRGRGRPPTRRLLDRRLRAGPRRRHRRSRWPSTCSSS